MGILVRIERKAQTRFLSSHRLNHVVNSILSGSKDRPDAAHDARRKFIDTYKSVGWVSFEAFLQICIALVHASDEWLRWRNDPQQLFSGTLR